MADAASWPWTGPAVEAGVAFTVVGRFAVAVDGRAVDDRQVGSAKGRRLLALLVVQRGHSVSTDRIVDALWGTAPPPRAAENVATLVSRLRRALGASVIGGVRGSYRLGDSAGIWVDVDAAEEMATRAQQTLRTAPAISLAAAGQALDLAGAGELLAGEPDADWLYQPRQRLARLLRRTRLIYAEAALEVGEFAAAREIAEQAVAVDALDEPAYRALMRALHRAGEPAAALAVYERLRTVLDAELGSAPAPETRAVHLAILQEHASPTRRPATGNAPGRRKLMVARDLREGLVGRDCGSGGGIRQTRTGLDRGGRVPPGIDHPDRRGRYREDPAHRRVGDGGSIHRRGCATRPVLRNRTLIVPAAGRGGDRWPGHPDCPTRITGRGRRARRGAGGLVPEVGAVLGTVAAERGDPDTERRRAYDAVTIFLRRLSLRHPVLLLIDDLHHTGLAVIELLHYVGRQLTDSRLLIAVAVRTEEGQRVLADLADVGRTVEIGPLAMDAVLELAVAAGHGEQAEVVARRSAGHPLYAAEMLRGLTVGEPLPASLQDAVLARVRRTGQESERILRAAAVLGTSFEPATIGRLLDLSTARGRPTLRGSVAEQAGGRRGTRVRVRPRPGPRGALRHHAAAHPAGLSRAGGRSARRDSGGDGRACRRDRRLVPRRAGLAARRRPGDEPVRRRRRRTAAGSGDRGRDHGGRPRAPGSGASWPAGGCGRHWPGTPTLSPIRKRASSSPGPAATPGWRCWRCGNWAGTPPLRRRRCRAIVTDGVARAAQSGLRLADSLGDRGMQADFLSRMAVLMSNRLRFTDSLDAAARAVAVARGSGDPVALAKALDGTKTGFAYLGMLPELAATLSELEPLLRAQGDLWRLQWTVFESSFPFVADARWPEAVAQVEAALALNRRSGYVGYESWLTAHLGWLARLQGNDRDAVGHGRRAITTEPSALHSWFITTAAAMLSTTLMEMGDRAQAMAVLRDVPFGGTESQTEAYRLRYLAALAEATGSADVLAEADRLLTAIHAPAGGAWLLGSDAYLGVARAWLAAGRPDLAADRVAPLVVAADGQRLDTGTGPGAAGHRRVRADSRQEPVGAAAHETLSRAATLAEQHGMTGIGRRARELLTRCPPGENPCAGSDQRGDHPAARCAPSVSTGRYSTLAADLHRDRLGNGLGTGAVVVHAPPRAVAVESVPDVIILLEMVPEREIQEWSAQRGQFHAGGQPALDHRDVTGGQLPVQIVDIAPVSPGPDTPEAMPGRCEGR